DPRGRRVVTGGSDGTAAIWDAASGRRLARLRGHADTIYDATWTPDGQRIVTASGDGTARVWDPERGVQLEVFRGDTGLLRDVDTSPDGLHAVTASADGTARVWDLAASRSRLALTDQSAPLSAPSFSADGRSIWTIGAVVVRHDATTGRPEWRLPFGGVGEM